MSSTRNHTTVVFFILLAGIAIVNYLAQIWYLYWLYPWFDIPMHFWGGLIVAVGSQTRYFSSITHISISNLLTCTLLVLGVGVIWEIFEWKYVIFDFTGYAVDTIADLCMDVAGGVVGFYLIRKLFPSARSVGATV